MIGDKHIFEKTFFEINKNVFNDIWMFDLEAVKFCKQLLVELLSTNAVKDDLQSHDIQQTLKITLVYVQT
jgi:patatin-like phospholipase/acyl hydrolase